MLNRRTILKLFGGCFSCFAFPNIKQTPITKDAKYLSIEDIKVFGSIVELTQEDIDRKYIEDGDILIPIYEMAQSVNWPQHLNNRPIINRANDVFHDSFNYKIVSDVFNVLQTAGQGRRGIISVKSLNDIPEPLIYEFDNSSYYIGINPGKGTLIVGLSDLKKTNANFIHQNTPKIRVEGSQHICMMVKDTDYKFVQTYKLES